MNNLMLSLVILWTLYVFWDGLAHRSVLTTTRVPGYQAKAKILVVRDIERDDIEFISKTLGHAGLVEEQTVRSRATPLCPAARRCSLCGHQSPRPLGLMGGARHQQSGPLGSDPPLQYRLLLEGLTIENQFAACCLMF